MRGDTRRCAAVAESGHADSVALGLKTSFSVINITTNPPKSSDPRGRTFEVVSASAVSLRFLSYTSAENLSLKFLTLVVLNPRESVWNCRRYPTRNLITFVTTCMEPFAFGAGSQTSQGGAASPAPAPAPVPMRQMKQEEQQQAPRLGYQGNLAAPLPASDMGMQQSGMMQVPNMGATGMVRQIAPFAKSRQIRLSSLHKILTNPTIDVCSRSRRHRTHSCTACNPPSACSPT